MLILVFARAGWEKFDSSSGWARVFTFWEYPVWFRVLIGVLELGAALLLLWPRTAAYGAAIIVVVMVGGMASKPGVRKQPRKCSNGSRGR